MHTREFTTEVRRHFPAPNHKIHKLCPKLVIEGLALNNLGQRTCDMYLEYLHLSLSYTPILIHDLVPILTDYDHPTT